MTKTLMPPPLVRSVKFNLWGASAGPGQTASGAMPMVSTHAGGLWTGSLIDVIHETDDDVRLWRALRIAADNGAGILIVPRIDTLQPWPLDDDGEPIKSYGDVLWGDDALWGDDVGWGQSVIDIVTVGDADLRATSLVLQLNYASALRGGEAFSIEHETVGNRMYEIKRIDINDDGNSVVTFRPPLREDTAGGTVCNFDMPLLDMQVAAPDAMDFTQETWPYGQPSVALLEAGFEE